MQNTRKPTLEFPKTPFQLKRATRRSFANISAFRKNFATFVESASKISSASRFGKFKRRRKERGVRDKSHGKVGFCRREEKGWQLCDEGLMAVVIGNRIKGVEVVELLVA